MTKKTNSLLFRLGINSFWYSKISNFTKIFNIFRLEKILKNELIKRKWNILSIQLNNCTVTIQLYDSFSLSKVLKQSIFRYYKKTKNIKKLSEKFSLNKFFVKIILKKIKNISIKYNNYILLSKVLFFILFWKKQKINILMKIIFQLKTFNWIKANLLLIIFFKWKKIKEVSNFFINKKFLLIKQQFQKINGFLYFKILGIFIENILFKSTKNFINVYFDNIWRSQGLVFLNPVKNEFLIRLLFLACIYNNSQIFSEHIAYQLKANKNHKRFLRQTILIVEIFWTMRKISLWGIQLRVSGKLDGRMRKSKYHYNIGKVQLQTLKTFLNYSISISYTKFGIISIKFWLLHGNK